MNPIAPPFDWVEYMPIFQAVANVRLDAGQLHRAAQVARRVHEAVFDPSVEEIVAALRTDESLYELARAIEAMGASSDDNE